MRSTTPAITKSVELSPGVQLTSRPGNTTKERRRLSNKHATAALRTRPEPVTQNDVSQIS
jgi:hypothetical protein